MKITRKGATAWQGGFKDRKGTLSTESGALTTCPYDFANRFEGQPGTNPEELIAMAGCPVSQLLKAEITLDAAS